MRHRKYHFWGKNNRTIPITPRDSDSGDSRLQFSKFKPPLFNILKFGEIVSCLFHFSYVSSISKMLKFFVNGGNDDNGSNDDTIR